MKKNTRILSVKSSPSPVLREPLPTYETVESCARVKVQEFLQAILEEEITELLGRRKSERRAAVDAAPGYRNGPGKPRRLALTSGTVTIHRPRVRGLEERFVSRILPLFVRRTKEVGNLLPDLYLHGLALGDFELALRGLLGDGAPLSPSSIDRLRAKWLLEYDAWRSRPLSDLKVVYVWADGVYVKAGLEKEKAALLVIIGALEDGRKEVLTVAPGYRESKDSWLEVLRDLKSRGLNVPKLLVADGHAGVWAAAGDIWPSLAEQRCWNHKLVNVLDKLPKKVQAEAKELLTAIPGASTRAEAEKQRDTFTKRFGSGHPNAVECLTKDWDRLVTFYDFPEAHWKHLRTTNVIESPFASVRLRTGAAKRFKRVPNATAMIWKVLRIAESRFRKLDAPELLPQVYAAQTFQDGHPVIQEEQRKAA
jgi:transposase-like protein